MFLLFPFQFASLFILHCFSSYILFSSKLHSSFCHTSYSTLFFYLFNVLSFVLSFLPVILPFFFCPIFLSPFFHYAYPVKLQHLFMHDPYTRIVGSNKSWPLWTQRSRCKIKYLIVWIYQHCRFLFFQGSPLSKKYYDWWLQVNWFDHDPCAWILSCVPISWFIKGFYSTILQDVQLTKILLKLNKVHDQ